MLSPWENHLIILYLNYFNHRTEYFILQRSAQKMQHFNIFMVAAWESRGKKTILLSLFISVPDRRVQEYNWLENFQQHFVEIFIGYETFQIKHFDECFQRGSTPWFLAGCWHRVVHNPYAPGLSFQILFCRANIWSFLNTFEGVGWTFQGLQLQGIQASWNQVSQVFLRYPI